MFAATVSGLTNTAVNFTIQESAGGLINSAGLYTAPTAAGFYHVVATSVDETTVTRECYRHRHDLFQCIYAYRESQRGAWPAHSHLATE